MRALRFSTSAPGLRYRAVPAVVALGLAALSASSAAACPDWQLTGQQVSFSAAQLGYRQALPVIAGGGDALSSCPQPGTGYVATRPDFDLTVTGFNGQGSLIFDVDATCDSVLLVNDARGQWHFDDDGGNGLNSRLVIANAPDGLYDVWVGTYGPSTCQATLYLQSAGGSPAAPPQQPVYPSPSACPDPSLTGQIVSLRAADLSRPQVYGVSAGGTTRLGDCRFGFGTGYVDARPQLTLDLRDSAPGGQLDLRVSGTCDTVLLVNDPAGRWSFNDDAGGSLDPRLTLGGMMQGQYDIWVGSYGTTPCSATLTASATGVATVPTQQPVPQPVPQPQPPVPGMAQNARYELVVVPEGITFENARQRAQAMGGHLATISSAEELQAVFAVANNPAAWFQDSGRYMIGPWLGGYRQGNQWMWITGEPWGYTAWAPGQPDNYRGVETHLNFWVRGDTPAPLLNDADPNSHMRGFVVEFQQSGQVASPTSPSPQQPQTGFFAEAWYNGERVDGCLYYGRDCGQNAADRFCQMMGYIHAAEGAFSHVATSRTLVLGDNRICTIPNGCGHLVNVTCMPSPEALGEGVPTPQAPAAPVK